jgi:hypothetical protein
MFPLGAILDIGSKLIDKFFPDPEQKAKAQLELMQMQQNGELARIQADIAGQQEVSKRWEADMASDSWLSKNIRPLTLIAILAGYFTFAMMSAFNLDTNEAYVKLLGEWGQLVMLAYFSGRTIEKVMDMKEKAKDGTTNS